MGISSRRTELVVDSWGHCLICLGKIGEADPENPNKSSTSPPSSSSLSSSSVYCIQYLSRYLKLDMRKLFSGGKLVSKELLDRANKSKLKVELCQGCASLTGNLVELCRNLERIQMEVTSYLELVRQRLVESEERMGGKPEMLSNLTVGKGQILKGLRTEVIEKCSRKLKLAAPRVKVQRLFKKPPAVLITEAPNDIRAINKTTSKKHFLEGPSSATALFCNDPDPVTEIGVYYSSSNVVVVDPDPLLDLDFEDGDDDDDNCAAGDDSRSNDQPDSSKEHVNVNPVIVDKAPMISSLSMSTITDSLKHRCKICGRELCSKASVYRHHLTVHLGVRAECPFCKKLFSNKTGLKTHQQNTGCGRGGVRQYSFTCRLCGKGCVRHDLLRTHMANHHAPDGQHKCDLCGCSFKLKRLLTMHRKSAHHHSTTGGAQSRSLGLGEADVGGKERNERALNPDDDVQKNALALDKWRRDDTPSRIYKCKECPKQFLRLIQLQTHYDNEHNDDDDKELEFPFGCSLCQMEFHTEADCSEHWKIAHDSMLNGRHVVRGNVRQSDDHPGSSNKPFELGD